MRLAHSRDWPPQPAVIESARLLLRPVTIAEGEALLAGRPLPGLPQGEGFPSDGTLESMELFVGRRRTELPGFAPLHMIRRSDGAAIGGIGFTPIPETRSVTVGYGVSPAVEGQGYASEALRTLIDWLFSVGAGSVRADTHAEHVASRRVMEKAGMRLLEEVEAFDEDGREVRYVYYTISRSRSVGLTARARARARLGWGSRSRQPFRSRA